MNPILIDLGIIKIYWYSFFIFLAFYIGGTISLKEAKKWKIPEAFMINLIFYLVPISLIGARLYYVLFNMSAFDTVWDILKIWEGGLAIHGGILAGGLWILYYTRKYKIETLRFLDITVVSLILGQAIGRWGNFFNSEAYGPVTTAENLQGMFIPQFIIDGMYIGGEYHIPTFLFESVWNIIGFIFLLLIRHRKYIKVGQLTGIYLIWYSIGRFAIEGLRQDSLMFMDFRIAQIVSIVLILIGIFLLIRKKSGSVFDSQYHTKEEINETIY